MKMRLQVIACILPLLLCFALSQARATNRVADIESTELTSADKAAILRGPYGKLMQRRLLRESLVLVDNRQATLPLEVVGKYAVIHQSNNNHAKFTDYFRRYAAYDRIPWTGTSTMDIVRKSLDNYQALVLLVDNRGVPASIDHYNWWKAFANLAADIPIVLVHYGDPYHLADVNDRFSILQAPSRNAVTDELSAQALFGGLNLRGRLPYKINDRYPDGTGVQLAASRMAYAIPEEVDIAPEKLVGIDAIAKSAIAKRAMPGCQVVVAKHGKIVYSKSFGHHTYSKDSPVKSTDLYDLASVTKAAATTFAAMKLYDAGKLSIDGRVEDYWPIDGYSSLKRISLRRLLAHQSGLQSNLPIAAYLTPANSKDATGKNKYSSRADAEYSIPISQNMFLRKDLLTEFENRWHRLGIDRRRKYKYSDVNFAVLQKVIESVSAQSMADFLGREFYGPMGLRSTMYRPMDRLDSKHIVPTATDRRWRRIMLDGYVHDESAALQGGIGGHAGLFSNAEDLAKLFQLLLNDGIYGNRQYLNTSTIAAFTGSNRLNHRGLGFDKTRVTHKGGTTTLYGHTGFSGTCVWVDPATELVYVFLSNRIHPTPDNTLLLRLGVRERILKEVFNAFDTFTPTGTLIDGAEVGS